MKTITNGIITIGVAEHGAELSSLVLDASGREYLWQADPAYWKRHSPVLFPIVGSVWEGHYRSHGRQFDLGQHGFARDMDFQLIDDTPDEEGNPQLLYVLRSNEETLKKYPYRFRLEIGYRLIGRSVEVIWRVMNPEREEELFFQIGAHPAFYWPMLSNEVVRAGVEEQDKVLASTTQRGSFVISSADGPYEAAVALPKRVITELGCVGDENAEVALQPGGVLPLTTATFSRDALIFEDGRASTVTLCDQNQKPYLTLSSEAPLMGLWSPPGKNAPFVCIEPWYGRCDRAHYEGTYEEKDWIQRLAPHGVFEARYRITIE